MKAVLTTLSNLELARRLHRYQQFKGDIPSELLDEVIERLNGKREPAPFNIGDRVTVKQSAAGTSFVFSGTVVDIGRTTNPAAEDPFWVNVVNAIGDPGLVHTVQAYECTLRKQQ